MSARDSFQASLRPAGPAAALPQTGGKQLWGGSAEALRVENVSAASASEARLQIADAPWTWMGGPELVDWLSEPQSPHFRAPGPRAAAIPPRL